jgi:type IV pilus assembly protein PilX
MSPIASCPPPSRAAGAPPLRRRQQGVALIVALVMLVVIGLTSAAVLRGSLNADLVAQNARVQNFAAQSAQLALRYCESQLVVDEADRVIQLHAAQTPGLWESFDNWADGGLAEPVPEDWRQTADSSVVASTAPQCLVERSNVNASVYIVTARGFSPDFSADADGRTLTGSVVWLQSQVAVGSGS